jgi:uncharacterized protein
MRDAVSARESRSVQTTDGRSPLAPSVRPPSQGHRAPEGDATPDAGFWNLPIELYATEHSYHVFDARKVVFIEVDGDVFALLEVLRDENLGADRLRTALPHLSRYRIRESLRKIHELQENGYLVPTAFRRRSPYERKDFEETLSRRLSGLTVHVTTQCNLACSYCIYGGGYNRHGKLSRTTMPWETARNMVDFLVRNSGESEKLRLDFFGGEPLLAFQLIRRTVEYAKTALGPKGPSLFVTISSNGTILDDEVLDFLLRHDVYLQFSIDGSKGLHDRERRFRNGRGSHDLVLANLERLHRRAPDYVREFVRIKSVITPESLGEGDAGFLEHPLIRSVAEDGHLSMLVQEPRHDPELDAAYFEAISRMGEMLLEQTGVETLEELTRPLTFRQRHFFHDTFDAFLEVQATNALFFKDPSTIRFTKGCLMGCQEGAVMPNGDIAVCHKATSFVIGNVNEGRWDLGRIGELQTRLYDPWADCASCFASRFCDLCHEKLDGGSTDAAAGRNRFCDYTRRKHHLVFRWMLRVLDRNPKLWVDLERVVRGQMKETAKAAWEEMKGHDVASPAGGSTIGSTIVTKGA